MDLPIPIAATPLQLLRDETTERAGVRLFVKRDDLIHPQISGNKWRKLKYNLFNAISERSSGLLTYGGAYSNHLYAVAAAGKAFGIPTVGIVRGEELTPESSDTLQFCARNGMALYFVSRAEYRLKNSGPLARRLIGPNVFVIPEGGSNIDALSGVGEMVEEVREELSFEPDFFAVAAGTGGTTAGILSAGASVRCFPALKGGEFLKQDIHRLIGEQVSGGELVIETGYHFGGYGRHTSQLLQFIRRFEDMHGFKLEQVYTGKMFFGLYDLLNKGHIDKGATIVVVHTGGLQGRTPLLEDTIRPD